MRSLLLSLASVVLSLAACADPPEPKTPQKAEEGDPVNSLSDKRVKGEDKTREKATDEKADPTKPMMTKKEDAPTTDGSPPAGASAAATETPAPSGKKGSGKGGGGGGGTGKVSKAECEQTMDKYMELEMASNPQLAGVDPSVMATAKQMAKQKHGDAPCTATRAQYTCAMSASTTAAWQRCMK